MYNQEISRTAKSNRIFTLDYLRRDFFSRLSTCPPRRSAEEKTGGLLRPPGSILQSNCHTRSLLLCGVQQLKAGHVASPTSISRWREVRKWWHEVGPLFPSQRREETDGRSHSIIFDMRIDRALKWSLPCARSRLEIHSIARRSWEVAPRSAATLIYYRCEECGKRFYYQHLLDYDDILPELLHRRKWAN